MTNGTGHDAQRDLEQRALRNVRGLVDRMEDGDRHSRQKEKRMLLWIVGATAAVVIALLALVSSWSSPATAPVDPAKLPPIPKTRAN